MRGSSKAWLWLATALGVALLASLLVLRVLSASQEQVRRALLLKPTTPLVVVARDVPVGMPLGPDDVAVIEVDPALFRADVLFSDPNEVLGRTPRHHLYKDEPVRIERLADRSSGRGLNAIITPGKRAVTMEVDTESGLAGMLEPGHHVDVVVTIQPGAEVEETKARWVTVTVLQNVEILAVGQALDQLRPVETESGQRTGRSLDRKPSVTLELFPDEVEILALAKERGALTLSMRSDVDMGALVARGPVDTHDVLGIERKTATERVLRAIAKPQVYETEVVAGGEVEVNAFGEGGKRLR